MIWGLLPVVYADARAFWRPRKCKLIMSRDPLDVVDGGRLSMALFRQVEVGIL